MIMRKVMLDPGKDWSHLLSPGQVNQPVRYSLQFFKSNHGGIFWHRIKSGIHHWSNGKYTHTSVRFYCSNDGFMHKGEMTDEPPIDEPLCKFCEELFLKQSIGF